MLQHAMGSLAVELLFWLKQKIDNKMNGISRGNKGHVKIFKLNCYDFN